MFTHKVSQKVSHLLKKNNIVIRTRGVGGGGAQKEPYFDIFAGIFLISQHYSALSLISTHAFRLSPAKIFAWDMCRVVKRIKQNEKISFALFALKFKYFNFCEIFSQRNQSDFFLESRGHFTRIKKFLQNGRPTALSGLREERLQYILKTRIIELETSFRLRQFFAAALKK